MPGRVCARPAVAPARRRIGVGRRLWDGVATKAPSCTPGRTAPPSAKAARGASSATETKTINLALQGGGAHGAFAWGVLDKLMEDGRIEIEGISATSAGAMNATVLALRLCRRRTRWRPRRRLPTSGAASPRRRHLAAAALAARPA